MLAVTNSLFRPVPLAVVALALFGWMMFTARGKSRWEVLRAIVISFVLSEVITQILKRVAGQARPTASIPGLDVHGYPKDPYGNAYPSAHTSVVVGLVTALWPWLTWPQRVVGVAVAALVALNRCISGRTGPSTWSGGRPSGCSRGRCAGWWRRDGPSAVAATRGRAHLNELQDCATREGDRPGHVRLH